MKLKVELDNQTQMFQESPSATEDIAPGAVLLRSFITPWEEAVWQAVQAIELISPFRHMVTPGGFCMSVAMTNAGVAGWVSDRKGYRYSPIDPLSGKRWPEIPSVLSDLSSRAAEQGGYACFRPDVCLINRYEPGARMALHQDKDERDFNQPIVSFSLGLTATFLFGGMKRADRPARMRLLSGDVVVWGGVNRLAYHGVAPLAKGVHPLTGSARINLTFRCGL